MRRWNVPFIFAVLAAETARVGPAGAQMILPGAEPPAPVGTSRPSAPVRPRSPRPAAAASSGLSTPALSTPVPLTHITINVPSVATILGKSLRLNGSTSEIVLDAKNGLISQVSKDAAAKDPAAGNPAGKGADDKAPPLEMPLVVTRLTLVGDLLSKPSEPCRIDVKTAPAVETQFVGHPAGAMRYRLAVADCPFTFDVLDGAILLTKDTQSCAFKSADCQVNVGGLWGPRGSELSPEKIKELERARAQADLTARETFHDLLKRTKGKDEVKKVASEQAGFSSSREETCRSYDGESVHHFCATRLTQARVSALQTDLDAAPPPDPKKERKNKRRE